MKGDNSWPEKNMQCELVDCEVYGWDGTTMHCGVFYCQVCGWERTTMQCDVRCLVYDVIV